MSDYASDIYVMAMSLRAIVEVDRIARENGIVLCTPDRRYEVDVSPGEYVMRYEEAVKAGIREAEDRLTARVAAERGTKE